jgi:two-component system sensor histidine kinase GlrK
MKITTRIVSGYGLFITVLAGLVVYQILTISRLQAINRTLSGINFQNALACLEALRDRDLVEEYAWKSFALADPDYLKQLQEFQKGYETTLMEIKSYANSGEELAEVRRLAELWDSFTADLGLLRQTLPQSGTALPKSLQNDLEQLRAQTESVYESSLRSMSLKVEKSRRTGETAALVMGCSTIVALAISILVSFLIFRSISKPLAHLTEGTRAIAEGKFFYRLDASRNDEFSQLARDFNTMTRRLNELDELKKDFVSHVSHELKAPLASMRETIQLLLEQIPGPLTEKQKRLLELNLQSGLRLTSMISNLLDLSRTEAGVMEYELKNQDLAPLVRTAVAELEGQAQERQIRIEVALPEEPLPVESDSDRIIQVIVNLVGNAVKFSPKAGTVEVRVEAAAEIPESLPEHWRRLIASSDPKGCFGLLTVADSGPGIPDPDKEKIFEKFHQVKQGRKMAGQGVGLGLAICRTIVQAHRGAVWVEDNPGGGSRFRLLLRGGETNQGAVTRASTPI